MNEQPAGRSRQRNQWWVNMMLALAGLLIPVAIVLSWLSFLVLDEERFVRTVSPMIELPVIQSALADAISNGARASIDNAAASSSRTARLVSLAGGLDSVSGEISRLANLAVATPQFAVVWADVNRLAHASLITILSNESSEPGAAGEDLTLVFENFAQDIGVDPTSRVGQVLMEIPNQLAPRISVLHTFESPRLRFVIEHARTLTMILITVSALLLFSGLRFSRNRSRALILVGLTSLGSLPIALYARTVLRSVLGDLSGPEGVLAREYASALTASLEAGLLMIAALGLIVAVIAWFWPRLSRASSTDV